MTASSYDLDFATASVEEIASAVVRFGGVVLRGAVPLALINQIKANTDRIYEMYCGYTADSADAIAFFQSQEQFRVDRLVTGNILPQLYEEYFGATASFYSVIDSPKLKDVFRRLFVDSVYRLQGLETIGSVQAHNRPLTNLGIPFHTDGAHYDDMHYALTAWVPLDNCGVTAPGLSLVFADHDESRDYLRFNPDAARPEGALPPPANAYKYDMSRFESQAINAHFGDRVAQPEFARGDIALFSSWMIHATYKTGEMNDERASIQLRLIGDGVDPAPVS